MRTSPPFPPRAPRRPGCERPTLSAETVTQAVTAVAGIIFLPGAILFLTSLCSGCFQSSLVRESFCLKKRMHIFTSLYGICYIYAGVYKYYFSSIRKQMLLWRTYPPGLTVLVLTCWGLGRGTGITGICGDVVGITNSQVHMATFSTSGEAGPTRKHDA